MSSTRTWVLAAVAAGLLLVDVAAHQMQGSGQLDLPEVATIAADDARRILIDKGDSHLELERRDDGWHITAPVDAAMAADDKAVEAVLTPVADGIEMDVQIDQGTDAQKEYGLKPPDEIRVRVEADSGKVADFYVGNNAAGGSTFVRLPGSEVVYRARIGGRARYDRQPSRWRDPAVFEWEPDELVALRVEQPDGQSWTAARTVDVDEAGEAKPGRWELAEDASFAIDQLLLDQLATGLGKWRALALLAPDHSGGLDRPVATVTATLSTQQTQSVRIGRVGGSAFAQKDPTLPVYQVQPSLLGVFSDPAVSWRDKQLVDVEVGTVTGLSLQVEDKRVVLGRAGGQWQMIEPSGLAVNQVQAQQLAKTVAALRVDSWVPSQFDGATGLPGEAQLVVETTEGDRTVYIGGEVPDRPAQQAAVFVQADGGPAGVMSARLWAAIRAAFGV